MSLLGLTNLKFTQSILLRMKFVLSAILLVCALQAHSQKYVQVKNINGKPTFQATATAENTPAADLQAATEEWITNTFLSENVITANTPGSITARYNQDYSDGTWSGQYEHTLQISISDNTASFTITDNKMGLIHADGTWKKHLAKMKGMYEQAANELFWSFEASLKTKHGHE